MARCKVVIKVLNGNYGTKYYEKPFVSEPIEIPDNATNIQMHIANKFFISYVIDTPLTEDIANG